MLEGGQKRNIQDAEEGVCMTSFKPVTKFPLWILRERLCASDSSEHFSSHWRRKSFKTPQTHKVQIHVNYDSQDTSPHSTPGDVSIVVCGCFNLNRMFSHPDWVLCVEQSISTDKEKIQPKQTWRWRCNIKKHSVWTDLWFCRSVLS